MSWLAHDNTISILESAWGVLFPSNHNHDVSIQQRSLRELFRLTRHADPKTRLAALLQLRRLRVDARCLVPYLIEALADTDAHNRREAARNLSNLLTACDLAVPALASALSDPDEPVRTYAAGALGSYGHAARPAIPAMVRGGPIGGLRYIQPADPAIVPDLLGIFQRREQAREFVADELGRFPQRAAEIVPPIMKAAKEPTKELFDNQPEYVDAAICSTLRVLARTSDAALIGLGELVADRSLRLSVRKSALHEIDNLGNRARPLLPLLRNVSDFPTPLDARRKAVIAELDRADWQETETELRNTAASGPPNPAGKDLKAREPKRPMRTLLNLTTRPF
jgi:hypothetical protein